jgi:hypothetical protein
MDGPLTFNFRRHEDHQCQSRAILASLAHCYTSEDSLVRSTDSDYVEVAGANANNNVWLRGEMHHKLDNFPAITLSQALQQLEPTVGLYKSRRT